MNRFLPLTYAALHVALAASATLLVISTDVLSGTHAAFLIH